MKYNLKKIIGLILILSNVGLSWKALAEDKNGPIDKGTSAIENAANVANRGK
ncbi:MAG: hypothetical protein U1F57_09220 [bacterium]